MVQILLLEYGGSYHIIIYHFLISSSFSFMLSLAYIYKCWLQSIIVWWHRRSRIKSHHLSEYIDNIIMSRLLDDPSEFRLLSLNTQRTTRFNDLTYCLPSVTTKEEHNQVAIESGMDPCEYRLNYHGTVFPTSGKHTTAKANKNSDINISATNPAETLPEKRI